MSSSQTPIGVSAGPQLVMCMILYSDFAAEDVHAALDGVGVAGYTELTKVTGRGPRGQHFDTHIWPGYDGMIYCVTAAEQSETLLATLGALNVTLERGSHGSSGLHVFTWGCQQRL